MEYQGFPVRPGQVFRRRHGDEKAGGRRRKTQEMNIRFVSGTNLSPDGFLPAGGERSETASVKLQAKAFIFLLRQPINFRQLAMFFIEFRTHCALKVILMGYLSLLSTLHKSSVKRCVNDTGQAAWPFPGKSHVRFHNYQGRLYA
ncbi:MAG: hypothetical protein LBD10_02645 [Desulfobulbus sp.]|uniref:hypothetical protein n=1 Tax=Desulfobulbus sp. TaxID=895 RepID=UPI002845A780|nr:hypothetical protein [Desulfobulbus sp.]MDR2549094.1 hypothetical protein [Desulfobulbus sp.]